MNSNRVTLLLVAGATLLAAPLSTFGDFGFRCAR
jgi:hypothetical protein